VFPKPDELETDGRSLNVIWKKSDVKKDSELPFMVRYTIPGKTLLIVIIISVIIIIAGYVSYRIWRKKSMPHTQRSRTRKKKNRLPVGNASAAKEGFKLERHLKEEEEQVVRILKSRDNQCEQGTLRVVTGFSKAYLSGLLKELEARNVVSKEKRGKKNLIFLKE
jgi:uncharacterized membrane protein